MSRLRRARGSVAVASLALVSLMIVGCGQTAPDADAGSPDNSNGASNSASNSAAVFPRTVDHAMGQTTLDEQPTRIVALDATFVDAAFSIDTPIVGFVDYSGSGSKLPDYLGKFRDTLGKDAVSVGTLSQPSLEKIARLKPDLIISAKVRHEAIYGELSKIAKTVFTDTTGATWKENLRLLAKAVGKEELADTRIAEYEQRATEIGDAIRAEAGKNPTVSVVRFVDGPTRLYQRLSFSGIVLDDAGLARPPSQQTSEPNKIAVEISEERIPDADADHIFVTVYADENGESAATKQKFTANPLWSRLTGKVHEVSDTTWMTAVGLQGAHAILDDLAAGFGVDPAR
jgi:iron complex transport system substrate-binding protein